MSTTFHAKQRRGFARGSLAQTYKCRCCGRTTRPTGTGDNDGVGLCVQCYDLAGEENHLSDNGTFYSSPGQVLALIGSVAKLGGDASCWDVMKERAEAELGVGCRP